MGGGSQTLGPHGRTRKLGGLLMLLPPVKVGTRVVFLHFQCGSLNKNGPLKLKYLSVYPQMVNCLGKIR